MFLRCETDFNCRLPFYCFPIFKSSRRRFIAPRHKAARFCFSVWNRLGISSVSRIDNTRRRIEKSPGRWHREKETAASNRFGAVGRENAPRRHSIAIASKDGMEQYGCGLDHYLFERRSMPGRSRHSIWLLGPGCRPTKLTCGMARVADSEVWEDKTKPNELSVMRRGNNRVNAERTSRYNGKPW